MKKPSETTVACIFSFHFTVFSYTISTQVFVCYSLQATDHPKVEKSNLRQFAANLNKPRQVESALNQNNNQNIKLELINQSLLWPIST